MNTAVTYAQYINKYFQILQILIALTTSLINTTMVAGPQRALLFASKNLQQYWRNTT